MIERIGMAALRRIEPERAHALALLGLRLRLVPLRGPVSSPRLRQRLWGLEFPNPVGLAAGFDKHAQAVAPLMRAGFGFLELGAVTPRPQPGNPRPRLFRLSAERGVINRFGFNSQGAEAVAPRLAARPRGIPVGLNLGANKDSADRAADFARVLARLGPFVDFAVVNVSSPNTERLRDLQGAQALAGVLAAVLEARDALPRPIPLLVKIAPDLAPDELAALVETALSCHVDGLVCTNTTLSRAGLRDPARSQQGGLSGAPLFERATRVLAQVSQLGGGRLPLIGVGGVSSGDEAYQKIRAGASAVQLYTALAFQGLSLAARIARELDTLLARDGFANVAEAVGSGRDAWL